MTHESFIKLTDLLLSGNSPDKMVLVLAFVYKSNNNHNLSRISKVEVVETMFKLQSLWQQLQFQAKNDKWLSLRVVSRSLNVHCFESDTNWLNAAAVLIENIILNSLKTNRMKIRWREISVLLLKVLLE